MASSYTEHRVAESSFLRIVREYTADVVVPLDFTPLKPLRTDIGLRHCMVEAAYAKNARVLTINAYSFGYPQSRELIRYLLENHVVTAVALEDIKSRVVPTSFLNFFL